MKINTIKVGPKFFDVIAQPNLRKDRDIYGELDVDGEKLRYDPDYKNCHSVIVHELIHALRYAIGCDLCEENEEQITATIETILGSFIQDNLDLCQWILDQYKSEVANEKRRGSRKTYTFRGNRKRNKQQDDIIFEFEPDNSGQQS